MNNEHNVTKHNELAIKAMKENLEVHLWNSATTIWMIQFYVLFSVWFMDTEVLKHTIALSFCQHTVVVILKRIAISHVWDTNMRNVCLFRSFICHLPLAGVVHPVKRQICFSIKERGKICNACLLSFKECRINIRY